MILTRHADRRDDGTLSIDLDRPITIAGVNAAGLRSVTFLDAEGALISAQIGGRIFPIARGVTRLVLTESAPFGLGPVTITTLDDRGLAAAPCEEA